MGRRPVLVCVFLRGGADGLNLVVPHGDPAYGVHRPTVGLARGDLLDIDGFFGLHPALAPLVPGLDDGELALLHAVGSDDDSRSHFEAQDLMEHGGMSEGSGWLSRHLRTRPGPAPGPLSAIALGATLPESLRGTPAAAIASVDEMLAGDEGDGWDEALALLHAGGGRIERAGRDTLAALSSLRDIGTVRDGDYPDDPLGRALAETARLIRADCGVEVMCIDHGNWDTHFVQGPLLTGLASSLAGGLAAFRRDLGAELERVTVVVMTEFGRRIVENASLGTDHGRGSVMLVLGGRVAGGRVVADWPGLDRPAGEAAHDLAVTLDYRHVLAEVLAAHGNTRVDEVFDLRPAFPGVMSG